MNKMDSYPRIYSSSALSYGALVAQLSTTRTLPSSLHVRNTLLAAYTSYPPAPSQRFTDEEHWQNFFRWAAPGASVLALGDVPSEILRTPAQQVDNDALDQQYAKKSESAEGNVWAVVILLPGSWPTSGPNPDHPVVTRAHFWLSSEPVLFPGSSVEVPDQGHEALVTATDKLLRTIVCDTLRKAWERRTGPVVGVSEPRKHDFLLFGIHMGIGKMIERLAIEGSSEQKDPTTPSVCWTNACRIYQHDHAEPWITATIGTDKGTTPVDGRWAVGDIRHEDVALVCSQNWIHIPAYVRSRLGLSVLIRDGKATSTAGDLSPPEEPPDQGQPIGWAYAHEDLSIGSLHVTEPYRRFRSISPGSVGLGKLIVASLGLKIIRAQRAALQTAGLPNLMEEGIRKETNADSVVAVTEESNPGAQAFFERCGFTLVGKNTWMGLKMRRDVSHE